MVWALATLRAPLGRGLPARPVRLPLLPPGIPLSRPLGLHLHDLHEDVLVQVELLLGDDVPQDLVRGADVLRGQEDELNCQRRLRV